MVGFGWAVISEEEREFRGGVSLHAACSGGKVVVVEDEGFRNRSVGVLAQFVVVL